MIDSILDNDLYKFTMQNAVIRMFPGADVEYGFINRDPSMKFNNSAFEAIQHVVSEMKYIEISKEEIEFLKDRCPYLPDSYFRYLERYQFNPNEVFMDMINNDLYISIKGPWYSAILWEVPLMATISDAYFRYVDTDWDYAEQKENTARKANILAGLNATFSEFGTRRRRNYTIQRYVVRQLTRMKLPNFFGTSNVHLAHINNIRPIGTVAHEWFMGVSGVIGSVIGANRTALQMWMQVYGNRVGFALSDTFGTNQFFREFTKDIAEKFDGVRHDSGDPLEFAEKVIRHYQTIGIDPMSKMIVFSDSLDVMKAQRIAQFCDGRIRCTFGIGTNFTNDFGMSKALNIVIKLKSINGTPVVKLSDDFKKATGDKSAVAYAINEIKEEEKISRHIACF